MLTDEGVYFVTALLPCDKPLFLSNARRQSVKDLGMQDQDEIIVCATSNPDPNTENTVDNFAQKLVRTRIPVVGRFQLYTRSLKITEHSIP